MRQPRRPMRARQREGAAMMIVLGLLLVTTAAATIAIQSTYLGLRASGHRTRQNHTQYISEAALLAGVDFVSRLATCDNQQAVGLSPCATLTAFNEPDYKLLAQSSCYRLVQEYFESPAVGMHPPITRPDCTAGEIGSIGNCLPYRPWYVVDVEQVESHAGFLPGQRVDDDTLRNLLIILTARGRTRMLGDVGDTTDLGFDAQTGAKGYHESANDARAYVLVPNAQRCAPPQNVGGQ